jgi:hypothetical protein
MIASESSAAVIWNGQTPAQPMSVSDRPVRSEKSDSRLSSSADASQPATIAEAFNAARTTGRAESRRPGLLRRLVGFALLAFSLPLGKRRAADEMDDWDDETQVQSSDSVEIFGLFD